MPGSEGGRLAGRPAVASAQTGVQDEAEDKKPPAQKREVQWLVSPVTQLMTPGGMPAAAKHCTMSRPATEPWVGGFSTRVLPAIRAGPILLQQGVARGVQDAGLQLEGRGPSRQGGAEGMRQAPCREPPLLAILLHLRPQFTVRTPWGPPT